MALLTVGPNSTFRSIRKAMAAAGPNDTIQLESGYRNETAWVTHNGMTFDGGSSSTGIVLRLGPGITSVTLAGAAPIDLFDNAADGNNIVGNGGDNVIHVSGGADSVSGGLGHDRLVVDYRAAAGAVTGDSTSNFTEAGSGGRMVTITGGIEDFTIYTGSGADTITTADGDDIIRTGGGAGTITAGQGFNRIFTGSGADTITGLDGGNIVHAGGGDNTITTGDGVDQIKTGKGADTIISGGGNDLITVAGGADTLDAGAGHDRLIIDYSAAITDVVGGIRSGDEAGGYGGHIADSTQATLDFVGTESFRITTGTGNDSVETGGGNDQIFGGMGSDHLIAGAGNDVLHGDAGADLLNGGRGQDILSGGFGQDTFEYNSIADSAKGSAHRDIIEDFSQAQHDRIDLGRIDADATQAGNQAFKLIAGSTFTGHAGELVQSSDGHGNTLVSGDANGDGVADFQLALTGTVTLVASDFVL